MIIIPPSQLSDLTSAIELLTSQNQAFARVDELCSIAVITKFELGGVLDRIKKECWFGEYGTFSDLCENKFGMGERKARYLIKNYNWVIKTDLTKEKIEGVAWTKLRLLASKVKPLDAEAWIEKARRLTVNELNAEFNLLETPTQTIYQKDPNPDPSQTPSPIELENTGLANPVTDQLSFNVDHEVGGPEANPEAAVRYGELEQNQTVINWMKRVGPDAIMATFRDVFPDFDIVASCKP